MKIAILALQGAFAEHETALRKLGAETFLVRNKQDWAQEKDGLVIPGGESTAMTRIMRDEELWDPIRDEILGGLPVFGTCAGLIMLDKEHLSTMNITALRNAYGRQLGSFYTEGDFAGVGRVPMTFIRAPYIAEHGDGVEVLATVDGRVVAARQGAQIVTAFHPELNDDSRIHEYFLDIVSAKSI
ncbi:MAG: pyridoxal 5'-phosphate synthase glutaminase subunit PdxT [Bacteroidales bacterium]|jgi:5'-phosphate synthase pdxT subunit|nr:pyridoxal 5'-phosphate synthase glutaminase subunit PdxT [Bacteroidales bacterium]MBQ6962844.1 pyridoxal 5'-phosphate synthase glutaminase subunit PdxT [Paludibacteraceae bacterium]